jgi:hypothetical protein
MAAAVRRTASPAYRKKSTKTRMISSRNGDGESMNRLRHLCGRVISIHDLAELSCDCKILQIGFSSAKEVRSRRVVTRSRFRPTGKYPSWKMERMVQWESINELNAFRLLDCDPRVTVFTEQPCEIVYVDGADTKRHYPDIYVEIDGNQELWEVKAECEASQSGVSTRTELLSRGLRRYGFTYRVALAHELAKEPRLENAKTLLRYGRRAASDCERDCLRTAVESKGHLNWAEICQGDFGSRGREIVCRLVLEGVLSFDLDSPLCPGTQFLERRNH